MVDFQCAVAAHARDEPMFATASQVRRWLLIEVRGAWGRDAVADTDLARHASADWKQHLRGERIRVVAIRRDLERSAPRVMELFYVDSAEGARGRCWTRQVATLHAAVDATAELPAFGDDGRWRPHTRPLVLVCTNGRHDPCCATFGRPLARALRADDDSGDVWECSHIGGDRFAGNLVILPEGLYFGRCDGDAARRVLAAYADGNIDLDNYRGRSVRGFFEQAAEFYVRRELGLAAIDAVRRIRRVERLPGGFDVDITADGAGRTLRVTVERTDEHPSTPITCTGPVGLRVPSYRLVSIEE
jgi:hypothetical protein